ncbi:MAG: VOC family protein [Rhodothermales bacterium]|nr:VOC family protein [Rhodothermales bacterium]NNL87208.1 VOC family protein [Myxococcales bacterium]
MRKLILVSAFLVAAACTNEPAATREFKGVKTVVYVTPDLEVGKAWYSAVFGIEPYFDEPFYVGFQVGDFELGLDPDTALARPGRGGMWVYWEVDDVVATYDRLMTLGATEVAGVNDVGGGVLVGTVEDPFGNLFGIIQMP